MNRLKDFSPDIDLSSLELLSDVAQDFGIVINPSLKPGNEAETCQTEEGSISSIPPQRKPNTTNSRLQARLQQANIPPTDDQLKYAVTIQESDMAGIGAKYG